jgi:general secretion pathway protein M
MAFELQNSARWQLLVNRYNSLADRERLALKVLAGFACLLLLYYMLLLPAKSYKEQSEQQYRSALDTLSWMQANQSQVAQNASQLAARDPGQSLLGIANQSSKSFRLSFKRYQPVGENGLSLWLDGVSFNNVVLWLERLDKRYNISVKEIAVERAAEKGAVNVRLVLQG